MNYETLLSIAPLPVWIQREESVLVANEEAATFFGLDSPAELIGESSVAYVPEEERERALERNRQVLEEGESADALQGTIIDRRGTEKQGLFAAAPMTYEGEPALFVIARNVTERRRRDDRLRRYKQAIESASDMLSALDTEYSYVFANRRYRTFHGIDPDADVTELGPESVLEPEAWAAAKPYVDRTFEGERTAYEMTRTDEAGEEHILEAQYYPLEGRDGTIQGMVSSIRDVTERKEREAAVQRERDRFSALFEHFPEPTVAASFENGEAILEAVNPAFETVFGYDAEAVVGEAINELIVPPGRREDARDIDERARENDLIDREVTRLTADGPRDFLFRNIPIPGDTEPDNYGVYVDITERKDRERELHRQNERLDEFASVVSHDLRSPLNVAQGRATLLESECESDHVEHLLEALDRMGGIIEDTLVLARQGDTVGEREWIEIPDIVGRCWAMVDTVEATLEIEDEFAIRGDRDRLHHVFENLFRNAAEHGGEGVTIRVGRSGDRGMYVEDDGPGIPRDEREAVFEPGHTSSDGGTGFGLTIVRRIAAAHGWSVRATESEEGGTRIEFEGVEIS